MTTVTLPDDLTGVFLGGQAPEQTHPGMFNPEGPWGTNAALKQASQIAGATWDRLNALHDYRVNRNPEVEPAVHARKLKGLVDEFGQNRASQWQNARDSLKAERQRVEAELQRTANLKANPAHFNAIVGTFGSLKPEQRMAAIDQAINEGDGATLATLLEAPSLVTGLTTEQRDNIKSRAYAKADGNSHALLMHLDKSLARADQASIAAIQAAAKLSEGTDRFDAKVKHAEALEAKVRTGFQG